MNHLRYGSMCPCDYVDGFRFTKQTHTHTGQEEERASSYIGSIERHLSEKREAHVDGRKCRVASALFSTSFLPFLASSVLLSCIDP